MTTESDRELLRPYLSRWLRERIGQPHLIPGSVHPSQATVLYADLSGFTRLTASFVGMPDGAEQLHEALRRVYNALEEAIFAYGGDVVSIAGDAITVWWPDQIDWERAQTCGEVLHETLNAMPPIRTPQGDCRLDMRIGIAAGAVQVVVVGLPSHGMHIVLTGPALDAATLAEREASPGGTTTVSTIFSMVPNPTAVRSRLRSALDREATPLNEEHFLPPAFVERLRLNALFAEYRRCVPVFATFVMPDHVEDLHHVVARTQTILLRWGGWLNEVEIGDKGSLFVMLFGAPVANGDDALRAVSCALELREAALISRAAITTGNLFVGALGGAQRRVFAARGDEMNLAALLMEKALPGEIVVSGRVRHEIEGRYAVSQPEEIRVKGHDATIPIARVVESRATPIIIGANSAMTIVGREQERRQIAQAMFQVLAGHPRLIILEGESGIGKSTLISELLARWREHGQHSVAVACRSGDQGAPLQAWHSLGLALCALDNDMGEDDEEQRKVLRRALLRVSGGLLILRWLATSELTIEISMISEVLFALVQEKLQHAPLLICIEDVHWADQFSLQLILDLINRRSNPPVHPLFFALSYRPNSEERQNTLSLLLHHPHSERIPLPRLSPDETRELTQALLGVADVQPELSQYVERHTEGQPLFIKESLFALRQRDLIEVDEDRARLSRRRFELHVSDIARDIVQADVDRLDEQTRITLKIAAVIGRSFSLQLLADIHPTLPNREALQHQIQHLADLKLIELSIDGPEQVYRFRYSITHDVAYTSLLFGQRRRLHAAIARWYERIYAADLRERRVPLAIYETLINHLRHAEDLHAQARYCRIAAEKAAHEYARVTAVNLVTGALPLISDRIERFSLLALRAAINERTGNQYSQADDISELEAIAEQLDDPLRLAHTVYYRMRYLTAVGLVQGAVALSQRSHTVMRRALRAAEDPLELRQVTMLRAGCLDAEAAAYAAIGQLDRAEAMIQRALTTLRTMLSAPAAPLYEDHTIPTLIDPPALAARCLNHLGAITFARGNYAESLQRHRRSLEIAHLSGDWIGEARARERIARVQLATGEIATAFASATTALNISHACSDRLGQVLALRQLTSVHLAEQRLAEAQRCAVHALTIASGIGVRALEARTLRDLARIALLQGSREEAEAMEREAERVRAEWWGDTSRAEHVALAVRS